MNILIIGSGGREHALCWKIKQSKRVANIYVAPGNAGTNLIATNVAISASDINSLLDFAIKNNIDLTVVGPEVPLSKGIVDLFEENEKAIFGPNKAGARIESSKSYAKELMKKYDIPTAKYELFDDFNQANNYLKKASYPQVIKADGLAAGKGVVIAKDYQKALDAITSFMKDDKFGEAGRTVVIEEFLEGEELSLLAFMDGKNIIPMSTAQDYKKRFEGNKGANTGGMGAYSPVKNLKEKEFSNEFDSILAKTLKAFQSEGVSYKGVIYLGLMLTEDGVKVLEYNCRFGDPETQVLLARLENDLVEILEATVLQKLADIKISWSNKKAVTVVLVSKGYPGDYKKGFPISGLGQNGLIFHAGTKLVDDTFVTNGGRVLALTALGDSLKEARYKAYQALEDIDFEGKSYRKDIALNK